MKKFTLTINTTKGGLSRAYSKKALEKIDWNEEINNLYKNNL